MVLCDKDGKAIKVYPYGSEEQQRYEKVLEILFEADKKRVEELIGKRQQKEKTIDAQIDEGDKQVLIKRKRRSAKRYNMTQTARILGVHRETLYYWIEKGWIKPRRDYKNYPVFTVLDIENLIQWRNTIKV